MHISMSIEFIRGGFVLLTLIFLGVFSLRKRQDRKLNWAIFNALLYTSVSLPIINIICINQGYWEFAVQNAISLPFDLYFIWVVIWGVIPVFFLDKRYFLIILALMVWVDLLLMPVLDTYQIIYLNPNWLVGEVLLISFVFIPAYLWAYFYYYQIFTWARAVIQILVMTAIFIIGLPFIFHHYGLLDILDYRWSPIAFQMLLIIAFPSLIAVQDLILKGKGTPFPYDPTTQLVSNGVYAYCRNPIQWSFTLIFIPLSIYHNNGYFLLGSIISLAYSIGVSDFQEYPDMHTKFGEKWTEYIRNTPKWYFLWKPNNIPKATIFFDSNCNQCAQISQWFFERSPINLSIKKAHHFKGNKLLKVTYIDNEGESHESVKAIAYALEHINLMYATLGWVMRFIPIHFILQAIVDTMEFSNPTNQCGTK